MTQSYRPLVAALFAVFAIGCTTEVDSGLDIRTVDESGDQVKPDEVVVRHNGERDSFSGECTRVMYGNYVSGEFDITATCGETTVEKTVRVREHEGIETATLRFPEDACESCP
jgi:hypothetical protein